MATDQGHVGAQYNLGVCFHQGTGVEQSYTKAMKLFKIVGDQNDGDATIRFATNAQYNIAIFYYNGSGVERSVLQASLWFEKAAAQGDKESIKMLKMIYEVRAASGKDYYERTGVLSCSMCGEFETDTLKLQRCPCKSVRYCKGGDCQKKQWRYHKKMCKSLRKKMKQIKE